MIATRAFLAVSLLVAMVIAFTVGCESGPIDIPSGESDQADGVVIDGVATDNVVALSTDALNTRFEYWSRVDATATSGGNTTTSTLSRTSGSDHLSISKPAGSCALSLVPYNSANQVVSGGAGTGTVTVVAGGSTDVHIKIPQVAPTIMTPQPAGLDPVGSNFTATAYVAAKDGVPSCQFWLDGVQIGSSQKTHTPSFGVTGASVGSHTAKLRATGTSGGVSESTWHLVVGGSTGLLLPPTASFTATPTSGTAPLTVVFDASASTDPDGSIVSYHWLYGDGATGSGVTSSHTYSGAGTYLALLVVTDDDGMTATTVRQIVVSSGGTNQHPMAVATATPTSGIAPLTVAFDASASTDPDGTISSYAWNYGDGATGSGVTSSHTYTSQGAYTALLTVTDNQGAVGTAVVTITVSAPGGDSEPPQVSITNPANSATVSGTVNVAASATDNVGVTGMTLYVDGSPVATSATGSVGYPWDTTAVSNSTHTIRATATDAAGNSGEYLISVVVNNGSPIVVPPPWDEWVGHTLVFYTNTGNPLGFSQMQMHATTPSGETVATVTPFFYSSSSNLELQGNFSLLTQGLAGGDVGYYDSSSTYHKYPSGVWSSGPWTFNTATDMLTMPDVYVDTDGDGSAEYQGTVTAKLTSVFSAGLRSLFTDDWSNPETRYRTYQAFDRDHR